MNRILKYGYSRCFTISIIGRPNVGKSSLFNKLHAGKDSAIVSPEKGVTRDRKEGYSELFKVPVRLVDTAGIEMASGLTLQSKMEQQAVNAINHSDLSLFVVDGQEGVNQMDIRLARWLRGGNKIHKVQPKNVLVVANKCENDQKIYPDLDKRIAKLGYGNGVKVAAVDGTGIQDLLSQIDQFIPETFIEEEKQKKVKRRAKYEMIKSNERKEILEYSKSNGIEFDIKAWEKEFDLVNKNPSDNSDFDDDSGVQYVSKKIIQDKPGVQSDNLLSSKPIMISVIGRVNMGKSTLINKLTEQDRVIADSQPGTTRDAITVEWVYKGRRINLIDTAGIENDSNNETMLTKLVKRRTSYALRYSNLVVVMIDSLGAYRSLDLAIAQEVVQEGRAIVLAINKWDLVEKQYRAKIINFLERQLNRNLTEVQECRVHCISAEQGSNLNELMDSIVNVYDKWNTRISTGLLNDWLTKFKKMQSLPVTEGDRLRIRFITQVKIRPPTFALFINDAELFKLNYLRYLRQSLCKEFGLHGVPIRFLLRDQGYTKEKKVVEKENIGKTVKQVFLRRRRLARIAKEKLESLRKKN